MCDQHHDHKHDHGVTKFLHEQKEEEDKVINRIVHFACVGDVLQALRQIRKPVDVYEHDKRFKKLLNDMGLYLVWGTKASHEYLHAYNMTEYTILTDKDLDKFELSAFIWRNYDLFREDLP